ncbi:MAG TPA: hypothetical protein VFE62_06895, partial [Gemmataceae bacterium]|nr:hypothetical protein [Gemmataceae bacterium]
MQPGRVVAIVTFLVCLVLAIFAPSTSTVDGVVVSDGGPQAGVAVGWQGDLERVATDALGRFHLLQSSRSRHLIATKPGYRIASGSALPLMLRLQPLP